MAEYAPITAEDEWFIGERKVFQFTIIKDGVPADITTWDLEWVVRQAAAAPTSLIAKGTADVTKVDPTHGVCRVVVVPEDTLAVEVGGGTYFHTLKRVDGVNDAVISYGEAVLQMAATR